jgi:hypothetical protein
MSIAQRLYFKHNQFFTIAVGTSSRATSVILLNFLVTSIVSFDILTLQSEPKPVLINRFRMGSHLLSKKSRHFEYLFWPHQTILMIYVGK